MTTLETFIYMNEPCAVADPHPRGERRSAASGTCTAPPEYECNVSLHEGGKCKTRPCRHCNTGCMYWRSGRKNG